jgi:hypothetical protein
VRELRSSFFPLVEHVARLIHQSLGFVKTIRIVCFVFVPRSTYIFSPGNASIPQRNISSWAQAVEVSESRAQTFGTPSKFRSQIPQDSRFRQISYYLQVMHEVLTALLAPTDPSVAGISAGNIDQKPCRFAKQTFMTYTEGIHSPIIRGMIGLFNGVDSMAMTLRHIRRRCWSIAFLTIG